MFLGLDLSLSSSGAIIIDSDYQVLQRQVFSTSALGVERLFFLEEMLKSFLQENLKDIDMVCIESPAFGISEGNLFNLGQWAGVVELTLFKLGKEYIFASPTQLKKYVIGKGKGAKQLMLLKTYQYFQEEFEDDNLCDAYGLARIAHNYYFIERQNRKIELKKHQQEVLGKIKKTQEEKKLGRLL